LKDRIGSQILTHYPDNIAIAKTITQQEANKKENREIAIHVPEIASDLLEQIGFEARESEYIDHKSGISSRMSITAYENLLSTVERRAIINGEKSATVRFSDLMGMIPSITGKVELVYEGEEEGSAFVAQRLIGEAAKTLFPQYFPKIEKLEKEDEASPYEHILNWFFEEGNFQLLDECTEKEYVEELNKIEPLQDLINKYQPNLEDRDHNFFKEFVLWSLVEYKKLSKQRSVNGYSFKDPFASYINGL
jgi:magnesium chelatase subunit I